jgi:hypothetical protein
MSYAHGPKPGLSRGAALSVLWLDGDAPEEPHETPLDNDAAAHVVAVARAKARVAARRHAQRERKLDSLRDPRRRAKS